VLRHRRVVGRRQGEGLPGTPLGVPRGSPVYPGYPGEPRGTLRCLGVLEGGFGGWKGSSSNQRLKLISQVCEVLEIRKPITTPFSCDTPLDSQLSPARTRRNSMAHRTCTPRPQTPTFLSKGRPSPAKPYSKSCFEPNRGGFDGMFVTASTIRSRLSRCRNRGRTYDRMFVTM
jgi:hypothetical protein